MLRGVAYLGWPAGEAQEAVERQLLRERVKEYILAAIMSGELKEGQRIIETQLARHLGVSQSPVREALRELEHMGVVSSEPHRGVTVKSLTTEDLQEMYRVRAVLEELAAEEAARRMDDEGVRQLREYFDGMVEAARAGDVARFVSLDVSFHRHIVEASGNRFLLRTWELVYPANWTLVTSTIFRDRLEYLAERHRSILDAIATRDINWIRASVRSHIERFGAEIVSARQNG